jgi:hypothetical protein
MNTNCVKMKDLAKDLEDVVFKVENLEFFISSKKDKETIFETIHLIKQETRRTISDLYRQCRAESE